MTQIELLAFINSLPEEKQKKFEEYLKASPAERRKFDLSFLDEPSEDLEKAAEEFGKRQGVELAPFAKKFFKAGSKWQREQMLKDAYVESQIVEDGRIELEGNPLPCLKPIILLPYPQFKPNNKVKIIIVKEDEK